MMPDMATRVNNTLCLEKAMDMSFCRDKMEKERLHSDTDILVLNDQHTPASSVANATPTPSVFMSLTPPPPQLPHHNILASANRTLPFLSLSPSYVSSSPVHNLLPLDIRSDTRSLGGLSPDRCNLSPHHIPSGQFSPSHVYRSPRSSPVHKSYPDEQYKSPNHIMEDIDHTRVASLSPYHSLRHCVDTEANVPDSPQSFNEILRRSSPSRRSPLAVSPLSPLTGSPHTSSPSVSPRSPSAAYFSPLAFSPLTMSPAVFSPVPFSPLTLLGATTASSPSSTKTSPTSPRRQTFHPVKKSVPLVITPPDQTQDQHNDTSSSRNSPKNCPRNSPRNSPRPTEQLTDEQPLSKDTNAKDTNVKTKDKSQNQEKTSQREPLKPNEKALKPKTIEATVRIIEDSDPDNMETRSDGDIESKGEKSRPCKKRPASDSEATSPTSNKKRRVYNYKFNVSPGNGVNFLAWIQHLQTFMVIIFIHSLQGVLLVLRSLVI